MSRRELDAMFARMNNQEKDAFIALLQSLASDMASSAPVALRNDVDQERQAHCDTVASELLAEMEL